MNKVKHIMLIDDDEPTNFLHQIVIERADCCENILVFNDGREALHYLKSDENPKPDLLLLDIHMPKMSGWKFLEEYQKLAQKKTGTDEKEGLASKLCLLSNSQCPHDKEAANSNDYVDRFLPKPLTEEHLSSLLCNQQKLSA